MKLHEYLSKRLFAKFGVPIPKGKIATTPDEARTIAAELGGKVVIKSQVLVGGRGKAGGIKVVNDPDEAYEAAEKILNLEIKGIPVDLVLIDEASSIQTEIYLGITNDRSARRPVMMASAAGGVDIEEVAASTPEKIIKAHIDPVMGLMSHNILALALGIELKSDLWGEFNKIAQGLWEAFKNYDATLAEINPLVITEDYHLLALDGKMIIDDSSLFRHKDLIKEQDTNEAHQTELDAREHGLTYIKLDGDIGCMVNGAGLAMATMDIIKHYGGAPANFLDIGGGANEAMVAAALKIIISANSRLYRPSNALDESTSASTRTQEAVMLGHGITSGAMRGSSRSCSSKLAMVVVVVSVPARMRNSSGNPSARKPVLVSRQIDGTRTI
jgi:succinyl-CoA synthetase beta subunit